MAGDRVICRCEEVTEEEIIRAIREGARTVSEVKRRTRAGMGMCQGKICSRLIASIILRETNLRPEEVFDLTKRPPVRPIPLGYQEEG